MDSKIPEYKGFHKVRILQEIKDMEKLWDKISCNGELCLYKTFVKPCFFYDNHRSRRASGLENIINEKKFTMNFALRWSNKQLGGVEKHFACNL